MKRLLVASCALLLMAGLSAPAARADTVWTLQNAQFGNWTNADGVAQSSLDGGWASGSFTLDDLGNVTNFDLTTTGSANFAGWTYNNSTATAMSSFIEGGVSYVQFTTSPTGQDLDQETLSLVFVGNLLDGKVIGHGSSLLCGTGASMSRLGCLAAGTPSTEFDASSSANQDYWNTGVNDPYRELLTDPPPNGPCGVNACVLGSPALVPEPGTLPVMLVALVGLGFAVARRSRAAA